ncbi:MAG TPA: acyl carrier protein [Azospirillum sp.]|nr:acyl carrier protein [Azospirillum sp.]
MNADPLHEIVADLLDLNVEAVTDDLTPEDAPLWDSLTNLKLVTAVEARFGVRFSMDEILSIRSVGTLRALVARSAVA